MKKPRTMQEIKNHPLVKEAWYENNGECIGGRRGQRDIWVDLKPGYWVPFPDMLHGIHELTVASVAAELARVERCPCCEVKD